MRIAQLSPYLLIASAILLVSAGVAADTVSAPELSSPPSGNLSAQPVVSNGDLPSPPASSPLPPPFLPPACGYFPKLYYRGPTPASFKSSSPSGADESMVEEVPSSPVELPLLANNQILAFYGHPFSKKMGILGEYSKEELGRLIKGYSKLYDDVNGEMGVIPSYYLIYGTCWPAGEIGYLKESVVLDYIKYAASQGMIVFLDHQIGKYRVEEAVNRLLPYLKYPNVHLALDPEWRTTLPMQEIGSITAEEVNQAQSLIHAYLEREGIPGVKMLVVHQFRSSMIQGRERIKADDERVLLIHTADGFGPPSLKKNTYAINAAASNMPLKGFKLFFKSVYPGAGYDEPLLTPPEVLSLNPRPALIIYQ